MNVSARVVRVALFAVLPSFVAPCASTAQQASTPQPAVPIEPIAAIIDAFRSHPVVALYDAHGNEQAHAFLLSLIRDSRFPTAVNDIVVSVGNARYQDVIDRFVRGEQVPYDLLRQVWQNTSAPSTAGELPTHEEFFRAVRAVNASLPRERQLRVLLSGPPIDWEKVKSPADYRKWTAMSESYPAALVQVEVLAKERRALLVLGVPQLQRKNLFSNYDMSDRRMQTTISLIEMATLTNVFIIWGSPDTGLASLQADVASWPMPSLTLIRGTTLGAMDVTALFFSPPRAEFRDGKIVPVPREQWRSLPAEEQIDAVLYLGPPSAMTEARLSPTVCSEPGYLEMRLKRVAAAGIPQQVADQLKKHCAAQPK